MHRLGLMGHFCLVLPSVRSEKRLFFSVQGTTVEREVIAVTRVETRSFEYKRCILAWKKRFDQLFVVGHSSCTAVNDGDY